MKIAAQCTHGLALRFGYEKLFRMYKETGFDGVDVSLGDMIHEDSPFNLNGYKEYAQNIRNIADSVGIKIHQTHAPFVYPLDKWETSPALMSILKRSIEISGILGAEVEVITKIGVVSDYYNLIHRHNVNNYFLCRVVSFGERHLTDDEINKYHLSTLRLSYEEAVAEYERCKNSKLGRLIGQRELPILKMAKEIIDEMSKT
jgi:hypothetical protein